MCPFFNGVGSGVAFNQPGPPRPYVNSIGGWQNLNSPIEPGESSEVDITYGGVIDTYQLTTGRVEVDVVSGSPSYTVAVINGTTSTPKVQINSTSGEGVLRIRILQDAVLNGVYGNSISFWSSNLTIETSGGK